MNEENEEESIVKAVASSAFFSHLLLELRLYKRRKGIFILLIYLPNKSKIAIDFDVDFFFFSDNKRLK